jgi:error-prone DNA polymerase
MRLAQLYLPELLAETVKIAERCSFSLDELRYEYPEELVPTGETPASWLRKLTEQGLARRFPEGATQKIRDLVERELALIAELSYEPFFLTVHDVVAFARREGILCQGRGSAANSAVCYALGVTEVNPAKQELLFERFISKERNEPPDIDVDFEHQRREEVIQYIYGKYGRDRAALAATLITYRPKSALRDAGKALDLDSRQVDAIAKSIAWWDDRKDLALRLREAGFDPASPVMRRLMALAHALLGFPRHLSQHVGGFVISRGPLAQLVPIERAAMPERSVIQWDKDDLESLGLLKVDVLALGMLSAIRRALGFVNAQRKSKITMDSLLLEEDPAVYEMIRHADTIGVFQIESRAQMSMLPRLKPMHFYDLVIEIAIVRPGPIQGDMVHPYLRRREGKEPVDYPNDAVEKVLERTLGVPIFQEQVMQLAVVAAGFTPGEADQLRRAMAAWKRKGGLEPFQKKLIDGMRGNGIPAEFADRIYRQILGFGEYGFPESHSVSFALLAYVSAWLKHHEPAAFLAALLNSQPMGFYTPSQLVQDARRPRRGAAGGRHGERMGVHAGARGSSPRIPDGPGLPGSRREARCRGAHDGGAAVGRRPGAPRRARPARAEMPGCRGRAGTARRAQARGALVGGGRRSRGAYPRGRAGDRGPAAARASHRGRDSPRRLREHRTHAGAPPARAAPPAPFANALFHRRRAEAAAGRGDGARRRHRHRPPATRNRLGHGVRHARGRDRLRQRHRLAAPGRGPTARAAGREADGSRGNAGARRRGDAPRRKATRRPQRPDRVAADRLTRFSLSYEAPYM